MKENKKEKYVVCFVTTMPISTIITWASDVVKLNDDSRMHKSHKKYDSHVFIIHLETILWYLCHCTANM